MSRKAGFDGVEQTGDLIRIRPEPKPGEKIDTSESTDCLDYTTAKVAETRPNA